jgi:hypothetical protein
LLGALAVLVAGGGVVLLRGGDRWAWWLAGCAGAVLLLRTRSYRIVAQRMALLAGGAVAAAGAGVRTAGQEGRTGWLLLAGVLGVIGIAGAVSAVRSPVRAAAPYKQRVLDVLEILTAVALLPLAAAVLGVYGLVRAWGG